MKSTDFSNWLGNYADAVGIERAALEREQTLLINGVVCTFVCPAAGRNDMAAVLIDAGEIEKTRDGRLLDEAMSRNLENFLIGSPIFLFNPESRRLVIGKEFEFRETEPSTFKAVLDSLSMQALAWQQRKD